MAANPLVQPTQLINRAVVLAMVGSIGLLMITLLAWQIPITNQLQLAAGDVAPYDVLAPASISYGSEIETTAARERAAQSVPDQYDSVEGRVRSQQKQRAHEILDFITLIRNDPHAAPEVRIDYLRALTDLSLSPEAAFQILDLNDEEWNAVVVEAPLALDRIMREEIRESTISSAKRRVLSMISAGISNEVEAVTVLLVQALIRPNSSLNTERTEAMREEARNAVPVQILSYMRGETIIRAGDLATPLQVEALAQIGLLQGDWEWWMLVRASIMSAMLMVTTIIAIYRLRPATLLNYQELAALGATVVLWLLAAKLMIIPHDWIPYLYPLAAMSMLITVLIDLRVAVVLTVAFALVVHFLSSDTMMVTYTAIGALLGALILGKAERLSAFLWAGLGVALSNLLIFVAFRPAMVDFASLGWFSHNAPLYFSIVLNGGLSASVALIGYFVLGNLFNLTTSLQLSELSRPSHPLLRQLLLKAPGTYHHTIVVSNLAERAAAAIGVDALLARVGAYYHDIGKTVRPYFFTENIADGSSPHDKLDPMTSAQIIISHVTDGIDLAQKYRLPPRIRDFILEHHGRSITQFFYQQAKRERAKYGENEGNEVNPDDFRYPGPNPRSKETAILLLADTCEAAVRAVRPATRQDLEQLVNKLIDDRVADGVLNQCDLTFRDLQTVRQVFIQVLQGVHHPRISYPEPAQRGDQTPAPGGDNASNGQSPPTTNYVGTSTVPANQVRANHANNHPTARPVTPAGTSQREALGGVEEEVTASG